MPGVSGDTAVRTTSTAHWTSFSVRLSPPVTLTMMLVAPSIDVSSSNGEEMADSVASWTRFSPDALPMPITASPRRRMAVRTSAKSRLISPGTWIRSEIPCTACRTTSSAARNASRILRLPYTSTTRSFGTQISVSTNSRSSRIPSLAVVFRRLPSTVIGFVTTATQRALISWATQAITGAAPVPVPPPSPTVMKTMSAPASTSIRPLMSSRAASRPTSGSPPHPSPPVRSLPNWIFTGARDSSRTWASVLAAMNSTPVTPASIIRFTALPPPPPMPTTLMTARFSLTSGNTAAGLAAGATAGGVTAARVSSCLAGISWLVAGVSSPVTAVSAPDAVASASAAGS